MKTPFLFLICLGMMCCVSCLPPDANTKYKKTADFRSRFLNYFREHHFGELEIDFGHTSIHAFFFDVDGDGVDEAFAATGANMDRLGTYWRVFHYQDGTWNEMESGLDRFSYLSDRAQNFYYRDDVREQPRLFIDTCIRDSPKAVVLTKDNKVVAVPFDRRDYEELREEGLLKPIESHWYEQDNDNKLVHGRITYTVTETIKGHNQPISPYAFYGDSDYINEESAVHGAFQIAYASDIERCSNTQALCVLSFDVDGDWLDEWFVTCDAMASKSGNEWHVFYGQHEEWRELEITGMTNRLCAPATYFYCREDTRAQPRLFIDTCVTNSPKAITLTWDKKLCIAPFDRQEFESLREKGIISPVGSWWYNTHYGLHIRTLGGNNKPIRPGDRFPVEDLSPGVDRSANFDDGVDTGGAQNFVLTADPSSEGSQTFSGTMSVVPGQVYLLGVYFGSKKYPHHTGGDSPLNDRLRWKITCPDGQVVSGDTTIRERHNELAKAEEQGVSYAGVSSTRLEALVGITVPEKVEGVKDGEKMEIQVELWIESADEEQNPEK